MTTVNHEYYVSLDVAKLLKEAGFDWEVYTYYTHIIIEDLNMDETTGLMFGGKYNYNSSDDYSTPTLDVAQRWLREVKDTIIDINSSYLPKGYGVSYCVHWKEPNKMMQAIEKSETSSFYKMFSTYEEALEAGIKKALEIILEKGE